MVNSKLKLNMTLCLITLICTGCQPRQELVSIVENTDTTVETINVLQPVAISMEEQETKLGEMEPSQLATKQVERKIKIGIINDTFQNNSDLVTQLILDIAAFEQETELIQSVPESETATSYLASVTELITKGAEVVIIPSQRTEVDLQTIIENHASTIFLTIDQYINAPNVLGIKYRDESIAYLLGIVAASQSNTNQIAYLTFEGQDVAQDRVYTNFLAGAMVINEKINVKYETVATDSKATVISEVTTNIYDSGVDVIFETLGDKTAPIISAAKKYMKNKRPVYVVNTDITTDERQDMNDIILASSVKNTNIAAQTIFESYLSDMLISGNQIILGLENEGIQLILNNPNLSEVTKNLVEDYQQKLINGEIIIPTATLSNNTK